MSSTNINASGGPSAAASAAHQKELMRVLIEARPVAIHILVEDRQDSTVRLCLRVLSPPVPSSPSAAAAAASSSSPLALHSAVFNNRCAELARLLFVDASPPNVNQTDPHGNSPLHVACALGRRECVDMLLRCGALPALVNAAGWNPIAEATSYGDRHILERVWYVGRMLVIMSSRLHLTCFFVLRVMPNLLRSSSSHMTIFVLALSFAGSPTAVRSRL
jgi:hypothetical protein